ncbi:unnamed protein product [Microthlaspi erraticum]|uniref:Uncharacterized protein n=1 Tax=Microthlaspi erraticum TaxID=1685480 RepID=A0A6D2K0N5_9BRAS|nr:unnamed protein product [Microthlaspi erraticum]
MQPWNTALEELNRLKEIIDSKSCASPLNQLQNRIWLMHRGIYIFFNHGNGKPQIIDLFNQDNLQSQNRTCQLGDARHVEDEEENEIEQLHKKRCIEEKPQEIVIDAVFDKDENAALDGGDSDSDGYLSEDSDFTTAVANGTGGSGYTLYVVWLHGISFKFFLYGLTQTIYLQVKSVVMRCLIRARKLNQRRKLAKLNEKVVNEAKSDVLKRKVLSGSALSSLCGLVDEEQSVQALLSLLNWYRAACHYGHQPSGVPNPDNNDVEDSETFAKVVVFVLQKADHTFRNILGISESINKEKVLKLKNNAKWDSVKPLVKSFLRSTIHLVKQAADLEIVVFALTQLRVSVVFLAAFPDLLIKLIKVPKCHSNWYSTLAALLGNCVPCQQKEKASIERIKVIKQEHYSYKDPICRVPGMCEEVIVNDPFLGNRVEDGNFSAVPLRDEFLENAGLFIFESHCRIHQRIDMGLKETVFPAGVFALDSAAMLCTWCSLDETHLQINRNHLLVLHTDERNLKRWSKVCTFQRRP